MALPKDWHSVVRNAVLNAIGIVRIPMLAGREALITNGDIKESNIHQLETEIAMLREELRINGDRLQRMGPHRRPQYTAVERMAILQLRAMRGWNKVETARRFFVPNDWLSYSIPTLPCKKITSAGDSHEILKLCIPRHLRRDGGLVRRGSSDVCRAHVLPEHSELSGLRMLRPNSVHVIGVTLMDSQCHRTVRRPPLPGHARYAKVPVAIAIY